PGRCALDFVIFRSSWCSPASTSNPQCFTRSLTVIDFIITSPLSCHVLITVLYTPVASRSIIYFVKNQTTAYDRSAKASQTALLRCVHLTYQHQQGRLHHPTSRTSASQQGSSADSPRSALP